MGSGFFGGGSQGQRLSTGDMICLRRSANVVSAFHWFHCVTLSVLSKVDHGFDKTSAAELRRKLTPLIRRTQPYSKRIAHKGVWVEPELLAEIEYRAKSAEGKVRHPVYRGIREDL